MEKLWEEYLSEGIEKGLSLEEFCSIHDIPFNKFENFLIRRRKLSEERLTGFLDIQDLSDRLEQHNLDCNSISNPDDLRKLLLQALDKYDILCSEKDNLESLLHKQREAQKQEMLNLETRYKAELESLDKKIADKDNALTEYDFH